MGTKNVQFFIAAVVVIFLLGISPVTNAQKKVSTIQKTVTELTEKSNLVVVGKVLGIHSEWNKGKTRIYTNVTVNVEEFVKGSEPVKNIVITHLGGEVGSVGEIYSSTPRFKTNEEVMLFLHKNKRGELNVTKGAEGKFIVKRDKATKMKMLENGESVENIKTLIRNINHVK